MKVNFTLKIETTVLKQHVPYKLHLYTIFTKNSGLNLPPIKLCGDNISEVNKN